MVYPILWKTFFRKQEELDEMEIVQCMSVLCYNSYDISKGKKPLQPVMRKYATTQSCRREGILCHFGASQLVLTCGRSCCNNCKQACNWLECSNNSEDCLVQVSIYHSLPTVCEVVFL